MSEEYLDPISPEGQPKIPGGGGTSNNKILPIVAVALIVLCCCCFAAVSAIAVGTTPLLDFLGI